MIKTMIYLEKKTCGVRVVICKKPIPGIINKKDFLSGNQSGKASSYFHLLLSGGGGSEGGRGSGDAKRGETGLSIE